MPRFETIKSSIGFIIGLIADLITIFGLLVSIFFPTVASVLNFGLTIEIRIAIIVLLAIVAVFCLYYLQLRWTHLDPKFKHLSIHYSSKNGSPNSTPNRPYYVKNQKTEQAYWASDIIAEKIKKRKIQWFTHKNEIELFHTLLSQGVIINDKEPSDKELGLLLRSNGRLVTLERRIESRSLKKLLELKKSSSLKRFQILLIYPKTRFLLYMLSSSFQDRDYPPNKRVLLDTHTKEAYGAPIECMHLIEENIIDSWNIFPWKLSDSVKNICSKKNCRYIERHYAIGEMIKEVTNN